MTMLEVLSASRDIGRLHDIAKVLVRHGLGDAVQRSGLAGALEHAGRLLHLKATAEVGHPTEVRVRKALEELGPTFIKLGQVLASRRDLLPEEWIRELERLHAGAAPLPFGELLPQLAEDLGADPRDVFLELDPRPLGAASIAQVHAARLGDGTPVVLKIRRPRARAEAEADLRLLARLAELLEERMPELKRLRPRLLVRQFRQTLRAELDLRMEARHAERMRAALAPDSRLVIPRVHAEWTRERLCVMDRLDAPDLATWLAVRERNGPPAWWPDPLDGSAIAAIGADVILRMVFVDGFFHADPHAGNVFVLPDGRLGLIDFGMIGSLGEERRAELLRLLHAVIAGDAPALAEVLLDWAGGGVEPELLVQDCQAFLDRYTGLPLGRIDLTAVLTDVTRIVRENDLFLPQDVALLIKTLITLEGLCRRLDPSFVLTRRIEPFVDRLWEEWSAPVAVARRGLRDLGDTVSRLKRDLRRLAAQARRGRVGLDIDVPRLERFGQQIERSANRVTLGLVTSALIVGTSIAMTVRGGPRAFGLPAFGFLGFASSIVIGLLLLRALARAPRR